MKIKHSKYKNTGLIYELLVKQITSDLVARKDSPAVNILRKYFGGESALVQEFKLYKTLQEAKGMSTIKADNLISATLRASRRINLQELRKQKYALISDIKDNYDLENFFSVTVPEYKSLAATYCLFEAERSEDLIDPQTIVANKVTLLEHITSRYQDSEEVKDNLIEEFSNYDKDLRLLTFKILLEKFNSKYVDLLPEQKNVLNKVISLGTSKKLREFINEEFSRLASELKTLTSKMPAGVERIKLLEVQKMLDPIPTTEKATDDHLVRILQSYDLIHELKKCV